MTGPTTTTITTPGTATARILTALAVALMLALLAPVPARAFRVVSRRRCLSSVLVG